MEVYAPMAPTHFEVPNPPRPAIADRDLVETLNFLRSAASRLLERQELLIQEVSCLRKSHSQLHDRLAELEAKQSRQVKEYYTTEEVAELFKRSPDTIRRWHRSGRLPSVRVEGTGPRGKLVFRHDDVRALLQRGLGGDAPAYAVGIATT